MFLLASLGTGFMVLKQDRAAGQWRQRDQSQVALNNALSKRYDGLLTHQASARATITRLSSETARLNGQVKSLQVQLASAVNAKKTLHQGPLLTQLTNESHTVSDALATCVDDMSSLQNEIGNDVSNPGHEDLLLRSNTRAASQACSTAEQDNRQLQSSLHAAG